MRPQFRIDAAAFNVTASVGVALYEGDAKTAADMLALADGALYQAKRQGRDRYAVA